MRILRYALLFVACGLLAACGPVYQTTYTYKAPFSFRGRECVNRCLSHRSRCSMQCQTMDQNCRTDALNAARPQYRAYARQQRSNHKPVDLSLSSFADFSACHTNCSCENDYRQCYSNCGGVVTPHTRCVAFCPKPAAPAADEPANAA